MSELPQRDAADLAARVSTRVAFLVAGIGASLSTIAFVRLPLGSLTGAAPAPPVATYSEPEWAPLDSPHSGDSHPSSAQISP